MADIEEENKTNTYANALSESNNESNTDYLSDSEKANYAYLRNNNARTLLDAQIQAYNSKQSAYNNTNRILASQGLNGSGYAGTYGTAINNMYLNALNTAQNNYQSTANEINQSEIEANSQNQANEYSNLVSLVENAQANGTDVNNALSGYGIYSDGTGGLTGEGYSKLTASQQNQLLGLYNNALAYADKTAQEKAETAQSDKYNTIMQLISTAVSNESDVDSLNKALSAYGYYVTENGDGSYTLGGGTYDDDFTANQKGALGGTLNLGMSSYANTNTGKEYTSKDELGEANYTNEKGDSSYTISDGFKSELNTLYVQADAGNIKTGAVVQITNGYNDTIYLEKTNDGFKVSNISGYESADSRFYISNGKLVFTGTKASDSSSNSDSSSDSSSGSKSVPSNAAKAYDLLKAAGGIKYADNFVNSLEESGNKDGSAHKFTYNGKTYNAAYINGEWYFLA